MNILILGSGARENIIKEKLLYNSENKVFIKNIESNILIYNFCIDYKIELVIPSTEHYLYTLNIVNYLQLNLPNIKIFGPTKEQAKLEGNKFYSKQIMNDLNIPTPEYKYIENILDLSNINISYNILNNKLSVIKYCGLAKGKGVFLPNSVEEFNENIILIKKFGNEGFLLEDRLFGTEVSIMAFCNGKNAYLMPQAQDFKRKNDNDKGYNTGGMGSICPVNILNKNEINEVKNYLDKLVRKFNYIGILYAGIIKTEKGIFILEFNCRFGDPEAQVILNLLLLNEEYNFLNIIIDCINMKIPNIKWKKDVALAVVLSHKDYPLLLSEKKLEIKYKSELDKNIFIYKSNIETINNIDYTNGGRVLTMVAIDSNLFLAMQNIYNNASKIYYKDCFYRRDIGYNYLLNNINNTEVLNNTGKINIGILSSGNGTSISKLLDNYKNNIKIIITNKKDAGIIEKAKNYNITYMYIELNSNETYLKLANILRLFDIELLLLCGFMKIVPEIIFNEFYTINIHPSLLPKYSNLTGSKIHKLCINNNEYSSGCTLHEVIKNVDEGKILLQKQYILNKNDNSELLKVNIQNLENDIILEFVKIYEKMKNKIKYNININEGNKFIDDLKKINSEIGGFCAEFNYKNIKLAASTDGCGTKLDLVDKYDLLDNIGIDLVAMNVNDLIAGGAKPLFFMDYIAIDKMDREKCNKIVKSINLGCLNAQCKLIGGETAEMNGIYLKDKYDLAGFAVGEVIYNVSRKNEMSSNCLLYGLKSSGIHSNGYTLVRELIKKTNMQDYDFIKKLLTPTKIYMEVLDICKMYNKNILGISHITGGGFKDNISRILPSNLDFILFDWEFSDIFKWIQSNSNLSKKEMLETFNCGYGMVIISNIELNNSDLYYIGNLIEKNICY